MPSTPYKSPFAPSKPSQVWDVLVGALQSDPTLKRAVDTWQVLDGRQEDTMAPGDEDMPLLRLEPVTGQGSWLDENAHQLIIPVKFTLGIVGTDVRILWDFWDAVRSALFTGNSVLNDMYKLGVIQKTISTPATAAALWGEASGLSGTGVITIKMRVDS